MHLGAILPISRERGIKKCASSASLFDLPRPNGGVRLLLEALLERLLRFEEPVERRDHEEGEERRRDETAGDDERDRPLRLRAHGVRERRRDQAQTGEE